MTDGRATRNQREETSTERFTVKVSFKMHPGPSPWTANIAVQIENEAGENVPVNPATFASLSGTLFGRVLQHNPAVLPDLLAVFHHAFRAAEAADGNDERVEGYQ